MQRHRPTRQPPIRNLPRPRRPQHLHQLLRRRIPAQRARQIAVRAPVPAQQPRDRRHHPLEPEPQHPPPQIRRRMRDVQRHQPPARTQHPQHLLEPARQIDQIAQHERAGNHIERTVPERQPQTVRLQPVRRFRAVLPPRPAQHRRREIHARHRGRARRPKLAREIARARPQVQHIRPARLRRTHRQTPPAPVQPRRHHPIHAVVLRRQPPEHRLNRARPLRVASLVVSHR